MISQSAAAVDLNVDAGTFYVDTTNNRVGVGGKTDPDTPLHVVGTVTATLFAGSGASLTNIPNGALTNSSITINSTAVSLGGSLTLDTDDVAEGSSNLYYTNARADARIAAADTDDLSEGSSNLYYTDARVDARVSGGSLGNITTTGYIRGPATFTIDPAAHGDNTGTVVIAGNLQVDGTQTVINSTTLTVDDKNITLASGSANAAAASGAGFTVDIGSGTNPAITYDGTNDEWDFNKPVHVGGGITFGTADSTLADNNVRFKSTGAAYIDHNTVGQDINFRVSNASSLDTIIMTLDAGVGSVGINQTSPSSTYKLDVGGAIRSNAAAPGLTLRETDASNQTWLMGSYGGTFAIRDVTGGTYPVYVEAATPTSTLYLDSSGNVGIGTNAPNGKLQFDNSINTRKIVLYEGANNDYQFYGFGVESGTLIYSTYTDTDDHVFVSGASSTSRNELMRIEGGGNVGIGNTAPAATLEVGTLTSGETGNVIINSEGGNPPALQVKSRTNRARINIQDNDTSGYIIAEGSVLSIGFADQLSANNININSSHKVGIGTTSPAQKFHVAAGYIHVDAGYGITWDNTHERIEQSDGKLEFFTNNGEAMTLKGSNLGIGTNNPGADGSDSPALDVSQSTTGAKAAAYMRVTASTNAAYNGESFYTGHYRDTGNGEYCTVGMIGMETVRAGANDVAGDLNFYTKVAGSANTAVPTQKMVIKADGKVGIGHTSPKSRLSIVGDGMLNTYSGTIGIENTASDKWASIALTDDIDTASASSNYYLIGRGGTYADRYMSFHIPTASNYGSGSQPKFVFASTGADQLMTIEASTGDAYHKGGVSTPLVTTNDIKASGAGGVSVQTDEGTKRIEVFDNGKITFNNLIYQSGINKNTINSGYDNDGDDSDIWINYRGYNDGHTRVRDFRIGDGKGNAIAFFDGSEMLANIHSVKVHTGAFRAVGTLPSTAGMGHTGVGLGQLSNYAHAQFSGSAGGYIDFAEPNVDWSGRIIYTHSNDMMAFYSNAQPTMYLTQTGATVRNGPNANQGKLTFSTQATGYNIIGGNYWGYLGLSSAGHVRIGTAAGETVRIHSSNSTGLFAVGVVGVSGVNASAAVHGLSGDAALVVTNTNLADSSGAYGWTGRGGRYLTSNGTNWTADGKDPGLVIGSADGSTQRRNLGIVLHNESATNNTFSPGIFFGNRSNSGNYNTGYAYIMGRKVGSGVDSNWSTGEIHMDTAGPRTGTTSRNPYMDDTPAFKIDANGDINMPYKAYAYGTISGNPTGITNNYGIALTTTRYQNCTPTTNGSHGPGITITKAGFYILNMSLLYDPVDYSYMGWCVNGSQIHHWHSNHAVSSNHDAVSQIGRYLNVGDHVSIENSNRTISTIYGNSHSAWYIAKIG